MKQREERTGSEVLGDATAYGQTLELLLEKDRLSHLGRVVRGLIHNINGPLQNLSMLVEMLIKGQDQLDRMVSGDSQNNPEQWGTVSGKQRQRFDRLMQQISLLGDILRDFMLLIEMERNESELDLNLVLEKLVSVFKADLFFKHQVAMELNLERGLPLVPIQGRHLVPALMHILQNAITAVRGGIEKKVIVESSKEDREWLRIVFRDFGCGLDSDTEIDGRAALFSRWPEVVSQQEGGEKHFGFGLYAVRSLLEPYGVEFCLMREGHETLAILRIPVKPFQPDSR